MLRFYKSIILAVISIGIMLMNNIAVQAETMGFLINWFQPAMYSTDDDCDGGLNLAAPELFARILNEQGLSPKEVEKLLADFPHTFTREYSNRGRINGEPVNAYLNPTSVPDPNVKISTGTLGYGFNLDGKNGPDDFIDPSTGEDGVDNMAARAMGCFSTMRGEPGVRPTHLTSRWAETRDNMPAWIVEVTGVDDRQNDPDVELLLTRAKEPAIRDANSEGLKDLTFRVDPNPRSVNRVHGRIKDGILQTDIFDFFMIGDPFHMAEYRFNGSRIRLSIQDDGGAYGIIGGYMPFVDLYMAWALTGTASESMLSVDLPGFYYALRKLADGGPIDELTGMNTTISTSFTIEAVRAFVVHDNGLISDQVEN
ncbi:MAG: hypothetical protein CMG46_10840 [Candidatus Marinimicrobia bacterium]|nr:hypothetical protein [Candidatus Neomarinimicrobiota bacterium]